MIHPRLRCVSSASKIDGLVSKALTPAFNANDQPGKSLGQCCVGLSPIDIVLINHVIEVKLCGGHEGIQLPQVGQLFRRRQQLVHGFERLHEAWGDRPMGRHGNRLHTESTLNGRAQLYDHPARSTSVDVPKAEHGLRLRDMPPAARVVSLGCFHDVRNRQRKQDSLFLDGCDKLWKQLGHRPARITAAMHPRQIDPLVLIQKDDIHELASHSSIESSSMYQRSIE